MSLFTVPQSGSGSRTQNVVFPALPATLEDFQSLPQAALSSPFDTAALTVVALNVYPQNKETSLQMLEFLRGPRPMTGIDKQFIADRFRGKEYLPRSYFKGAVPENDYAPQPPYTVTVSENPYSYQNQGYAKLFIACGGADSPRPIQLRMAKDNKWYLWEQALLTGIREPESANPWA